MFLLGRRIWAERRKGASGARTVYLVVAVAFAALALAAALTGNGGVAVAAGLAAAITFAGTLAAPRLARWLSVPRDNG
ncbi:MAG: hypothetical protein J4N26_00465 [Chloroflexi bacterium]|nr:hypothetical protein [Chloroflexota bacterium]